MTTSLPSARSRLPSSRLGGEPTVLPPPGAVPAGQLRLGLAGSDAPPAPSPTPLAERLTRPMVDVAHVRTWLSPTEQRELVERFREWARPPAGLRHPRVPTGHLMSVQSVCLGWHWQPYTYSRTADDTDGAPVKPMPAELVDLARRAVADVGPFGDGHGDGDGDGDSDRDGDGDGDRDGRDRRFDPDAVIVNYYAPGARLGLHQDGEEPSDAPVVTISLGDTCTFRLAGVDRRTGPFVDVELASGDLLVFGGCNRRIHHGVPRVLDGTAPTWLDLPPGRLSITIRETGLE
jgi:alkylated DNA repair protein (DNA oxidative demethylase)